MLFPLGASRECPRNRENSVSSGQRRFLGLANGSLACRSVGVHRICVFFLVYGDYVPTKWFPYRLVEILRALFDRRADDVQQQSFGACKAPQVICRYVQSVIHIGRILLHIPPEIVCPRVSVECSIPQSLKSVLR